MRNPNSYGSIYKMSGNRRRPYRVQITTGWELTEDKARQIRKTLGYYATKKEAAIALAEYNANPYDMDKQTATLLDIWKRIQPSVSVSEARMKVYEASWKKYLTTIENRKISQIKGQELQDVIDSIDAGYSVKVNVRTVLKHIYRYAYQNDYVDKDYTQFIKIEREEVQLQRMVYTSEEIEKLWEAKDKLYNRITLMLLYQGTRIKELLELPIENIDLEAGTFKITEAKNKQSVRELPIHESVRELWQASISEAKTDRLFDVTKRQYYYFCKTILGHDPYDTRHTFATRATELDLKKVVIQRIMGHKPDSVLEQYYTHLTIEELSKELNRVCY